MRENFRSRVLPISVAVVVVVSLSARMRVCCRPMRQWLGRTLSARKRRRSNQGEEVAHKSGEEPRTKVQSCARVRMLASGHLSEQCRDAPADSQLFPSLSCRTTSGVIWEAVHLSGILSRIDRTNRQLVVSDNSGLEVLCCTNKRHETPLSKLVQVVIWRIWRTNGSAVVLVGASWREDVV